MKLVKQPTPTTCGQACIAMLRGVSVPEAIALVGHDGISSDRDMLLALNEPNDFVGGVPPSNCVALQKHREPNGFREHWTVSNCGMVLDPAQRGKRLWPVIKYVILSEVT